MIVPLRGIRRNGSDREINAFCRSGRIEQRGRLETVAVFEPTWMYSRDLADVPARVGCRRAITDRERSNDFQIRISEVSQHAGQGHASCRRAR